VILFISQRTEFSFNVFAEFAGWAIGERYPAIPWDDVVEHPQRYFDTSLYKLPCPLNAPEVLKSTPRHIFSLHEFFLISISTSLPFQFRSKQEITNQISSVVGDELDNTEGDASPNSALFPMSPATITLSPRPILPSPAHRLGAICGSFPRKSPSESETSQSTANPETVSASSTSVADPSSIIANSGPTMTLTATSPSQGATPTLANPPPSTALNGTGTKGKGHTKRASASGKAKGLRKKTESAAENQPSIVVTNSIQVERLASTRKSDRAADLKRKQADNGIEKSEPMKKKRRLQDRWFYEPVIPVVNPASRP